MPSTSASCGYSDITKSDTLGIPNDSPFYKGEMDGQAAALKSTAYNDGYTAGSTGSSEGAYATDIPCPGPFPGFYGKGAYNWGYSFGYGEKYWEFYGNGYYEGKKEYNKHQHITYPSTISPANKGQPKMDPHKVFPPQKSLPADPNRP